MRPVPQPQSDPSRVGLAVPPRVIDRRYQLDTLIHRGPDAEVHRAEHLGIRRTVEVKTLPAQCGPHDALADRLFREARAMGSVAHRNVQSVVDSGTDEQGRPYVVYEALEGVPLTQALQQYPTGLPTAHAVDWMVQVLEGLHAVHRGGVVHRALCPDNVVVVPVRGRPELIKLKGFGDAVFGMGTYNAAPVAHAVPDAYRAPELANPENVTALVDIYAAGVLLRNLLTGRSGSSAAPVTDTARRTIERAVAERPEDRFPSAELFLHAVSLLAQPSMPPPPLGVPLEEEDPLKSDFRYLQRRRERGHVDRNTQVGQGRLALLPVLLIVEAIYKALGDDQWTELLSRVPEVDQLLPGSEASGRYLQHGVPATLVGRMLAEVDDLGGQGELGLLIDIGERVARRAWDRLMPSDERDQSDGSEAGEIFDRFGELWTRLTGEEVVETAERGPTSVRLNVRSRSEPKLELCAVVAGAVRVALRERVAGEAGVHVPTCQGVGDSVTTFAMHWAADV